MTDPLLADFLVPEAPTITARAAPLNDGGPFPPATEARLPPVGPLLAAANPSAVMLGVEERRR